MTPIAGLVLGLLMSVQPAQDARAEAERLARAGAREDALKRFQAIAAENPGDVSARLWIGRLHLEMNHPERAAAVFESIGATEAQNVDALVGLAQAFTRLGRFRDAAAAVDRAETLAADRLDVLAAQGALHGAAGRTTLALAYYARALAIEPGNQAVRDASDAIRAARAHRVEADYDFQTFNDSRRNTHTGTIDANVRITDRMRVFARAQVHEGELDTEARGGAGVEWMASHKMWLRAGALVGSDTIDLPKLDAFADATIRQGRALWALEGRLVVFESAELWIGGARLAMTLPHRMTAFGAYHRGRTSFELGDSSTSDNITLGLARKIGRRASVFADYRHGIDRLDWLTLDRVDADDANTIGIGGMTDLTPFVSIEAGYDYQTRPLDLRLQRARARLIVRF